MPNKPAMLRSDLIETPLRVFQKTARASKILALAIAGAGLAIGCSSDSGSLAHGLPPAMCGTDAPIVERTSDAQKNLTVIPLPENIFAGTGITATSEYFAAFDLREGALMLLPVSGTPPIRYGRTGEGPGEFAPYGQSERLRRYPVQWIDAASDTIMVFDGRRVLRFLADSGYIGSYNIAPAVKGKFVMVGSIRSWRDRVLLGEYNPGMFPQDAQRQLVIYSIGRDSTHAVTNLPLTPLPTSSSGYRFGGLAEANPSWDSYGDCVVTTDGHSDSLIITHLVTGNSASVKMDIPNRFRSGKDEQANAVMGHDKYPLPARASRIIAISAEPNGWLWLLPAMQDWRAPNIEVWKVNMHTLRTVIDTVAAFPRHWEASGCALGLKTNASDETMIVRMCD